MVGQCTCGLYHNSTQTNTFSMLLSSVPSNNHKPFDEFDDFSSSYSTAVDCTLSLGTPSTRLSNQTTHYTKTNTNNNNYRKSSGSSNLPNFCSWDLLQPKHTPSTQPWPSKNSKSNRGSNTIISRADPLLARRCANCQTTSTPLWRNGPRGPKSLCNACGIRFKKEERRATATSTSATTNSGGGPVAMESNSWAHHHYSELNQKVKCISATSFGNEYRFMDDDEHHSQTGIQFLSWRLNVTDRATMVHDFT